MAANWIKIEAITPDKVEVAKLAESFNLDDPDYVLGKLLRFWIWADSNTRDGVLPVKFSHIDRIVYCPGFARALVSVGWLQGREGRLVIPNFDRHCSNSAKARALEAEAKRLRRSGKDLSDGESDIMSDESPTQCPTTVRHNVRPDKIREEIDRIGDKTRAEVNRFPTDSSEVERFIAAQPVRPPSPESVSDCAAAFFDAFEARGWRDSRGVLLHDWRPAARSYARTWARNTTQNNAESNHKPKKKDDYRL